MHHKHKSLFHNSSFAIACPVPYHPSRHHLQRGRVPKIKSKRERNYHKQWHKIHYSRIQKDNWFAFWMIHVGKAWSMKYRILFKCINLHQHSLCTFCLHVLAFRGLSNINREHDDLRCHGWHLVAEAELVGSVHVCCHGVFSTGFSVAFVNLLAIRPCYLKKDTANISVKTTAVWGHDISNMKHMATSVYTKHSIAI